MDLIVLVVYLVVANPALTGIGVHEWLGIAAFVAFVAHAAQHGDWVAETARTAFARPSLGRTGHFVLDALIVVAFMTCTVSGVLVSGAVLPALGLYADGFFFWNPLHAASAKVLLALLVVHVVAHWRWIAGLFRGSRDKRGQEAPRTASGGSDEARTTK
ncbi:MAG TPA: DUF4405 domain-containing protein [Candidatus Aveggerthella excrementigallinarum]|nr:DUF4405 domain-containing protein [Candidatus Aveggerthella excrementigallinarum]